MRIKSMCKYKRQIKQQAQNNSTVAFRRMGTELVYLFIYVFIQSSRTWNTSRLSRV